MLSCQGSVKSFVAAGLLWFVYDYSPVVVESQGEAVVHVGRQCTLASLSIVEASARQMEKAPRLALGRSHFGT